MLGAPEALQACFNAFVEYTGSSSDLSKHARIGKTCLIFSWLPYDISMIKGNAIERFSV